MRVRRPNDVTQMDQRPYPGPPLLFHLRMVVLFSILYVIDLVMFFFTVEHTLSVGVGGMVLFASEVCRISSRPYHF